MEELKEDIKEFKTKVSYKFDKMNDDLETYKDHLRTLDTNIQNHVIGCGLDAYKAEMRERCERLNDNWQSNRTQISEHKHENEAQFTKLEDDFVVKLTEHKAENDIHFNKIEEAVVSKASAAKALSGKIISSGLIIGLCLVGVFSSININKVSQTEFRQHVEASSENMNEQVAMFNKFMDSYSDDRIRRDTKLDAVLDRQMEFNQGMMKNTSLLQQQLEVLKTQVDYDHSLPKR
jgi:hypothetical protein